MMLFAVIDKLLIFEHLRLVINGAGQVDTADTVFLYKCFIFLYGVHHMLFYEKLLYINSHVHLSLK